MTNRIRHCPACKAKNTGRSSCRRCGLDFSGLIHVLNQAASHDQKARQAYMENDFSQMLFHARRAVSLHRTSESLQLFACAALLNQKFNKAVNLWEQIIGKQP